jgi:hypothetical protein
MAKSFLEISIILETIFSNLTSHQKVSVAAGGVSFISQRMAITAAPLANACLPFGSSQEIFDFIFVWEIQEMGTGA